MNAPVLDCSVTMAWVFRDEPSAEADAALEQVTAFGGVAPALWWVEMRNVLLIAERRGRLTPQDTLVALRAIEELHISSDSRAGRRCCAAACQGTPTACLRRNVSGTIDSAAAAACHLGSQT